MSSIPEQVRLVLENTEPLRWARDNRLPLYLWPIMDLAVDDEVKAKSIIQQLDERGIGLISTWNPSDRERTLTRGLQIARIQKQLGLRVNVNANLCTYSFFNGDLRTAHIDGSGGAFFDSSFGEGHKMGCPFALDFRRSEMQKRVEFFVQAYYEADLEIGFIFADWEIDGPIEWNGAWTASKSCQRCQDQIEDIGDFTVFQSALRQKRSELQREMLADTVTSCFPNALVGNYGVYPHDGHRYWYDYFEKFVDGAPYIQEGGAKYRQWFDEFPLTGYTFAMPVVYTWDKIWSWYDFDQVDYRWFYNMLKVGSNAGKSTSSGTPIVTFVHWHTVYTTDDGNSDIQQFSENMYQELLWHLLLRGHDTLFMWCPLDQAAQEVRLVHQVYAASLEYKDFLELGIPINFDVPFQPGPVISGIRLGDHLLLRRTDFDDTRTDVTLTVDGFSVEVPRILGRCMIKSL